MLGLKGHRDKLGDRVMGLSEWGGEVGVGAGLGVEAQTYRAQ